MIGHVRAWSGLGRVARRLREQTPLEALDTLPRSRRLRGRPSPP